MKRTVFCGIDRFDIWKPLLENARVGLITNPTGIDRNFRATIDRLSSACKLCCLFSPEHGVRGEKQAGDHVDSYIDESTALPVYSLYGDSPHIPDAILSTLDVIVFDIQDVGARFYTYLYTLSYAMADCAKAGKHLVVFDRINPIGRKIEGTVLDPAFRSFVGRFPIATRYGMTIGEYARYINDSQHIGCDLSVVSADGWDGSYYDETDLAWVMPSPNLPTIDSCLCYIGTCLAEGTNLSEGRGTTKPFELIGAPWLCAKQVVEALNEMNLPGVKLRTCYFTPTFSKHAGELCQGIALHITDRDTFSPFETAIRLFDYIRKTHADFAFLPPVKEHNPPFIDLLLGTDTFRSESFDADQFLKECTNTCKDYAKKIRPYQNH